MCRVGGEKAPYLFGHLVTVAVTVTRVTVMVIQTVSIPCLYRVLLRTATSLGIQRPVHPLLPPLTAVARAQRDKL